jgi:hypothetical protein
VERGGRGTFQSLWALPDPKGFSTQGKVRLTVPQLLKGTGDPAGQTAGGHTSRLRSSGKRVDFLPGGALGSRGHSPWGVERDHTHN